ncbi:GSCFA domain-containing protein [Xanthovirga aplysinae]|uniref:GSCFA domain-containing protein n=1 Tax=Xanthovirga aplysinae TaxID=2529853 RepID=UPI001656C7D9|nr:GSCFA domain-containing protein [Xanthovirga aplysinae]
MFRTTLSLSPSSFQLNHQTAVLTLGSCFADAMGSRFLRDKFQVCKNPFGVLFNPLSAFHLLESVINLQFPEDNTFIEREGIYFNYNLHSDFSGKSLKELQNKIQETFETTNNFLKTSQYLILTFGTAIIYQIKDSDQTVANCHKMPAQLFHKRLLRSEEIELTFKKLYKLLKTFNPAIRMILTVSPIRHIKDTLELNAVSKSTVRIACHHLESRFEDVEYFPSYEIMMDDLRDYRFYSQDMLHPTEVAEEYIWEKFSNRYFSQKTQNLLIEWTKLRKAITHRPFHPESNAHQAFLKKTIQKLENLSNKIDVSREMAHLKNQLI